MSIAMDGSNMIAGGYGNSSQIAQLEALFQDVYGRSMTSADWQRFGPLIQTSSWDDIPGILMRAQQQTSRAPTAGYSSFLGGMNLPMMPPAVGGGIAKLPGTLGTIGGIIGGIGTIIDQFGGKGGGGGPGGGGGIKLPGIIKAPLLSNNCPPGYHLVVKKGLGIDALARDVCVRKRRMNVMNKKALSRANSRVNGFTRAAVPILKGLGFHVSTTRKPSGRVKASSRRAPARGCGCK